MNTRFKLIVVSTSTFMVALLLAGAMLGHGADLNSSDPYKHIHVFTEVFSRIKSDYVEEPDMKNVTMGAINGLMIAVDPFGSYLTPDQYKQYLKSSESAKGGVGLLLSRKYGYEIGVVDAIPGSPADKAGIATGDFIEAINGIPTREMPLAWADHLMKGEPGSEVELTVLRLRKPEPVKTKLKRAIIVPPALTSKMVENKTGLVTVSSMQPGTAKVISAAVTELLRQGAERVALDLRHNAWSDPQEGVNVARLFLEKGSLGSFSGQRTGKQEVAAEPSQVIFKGPLVVMTNRGTTGAAEIVALALLENKRADVVGERTFGDAAIRKAVQTSDGGAVLLAVSRFFGATGKAIQETSVTPSVLVADTSMGPDDDDDAAPSAPKPQEDAILKKALEVLAKAGSAVAARK